MDGSESLRFRRMLPEANIIALEPNPENFERMKAEQQLADESIRIFPFAASDHASQEPFYLVDADYDLVTDGFRRGMSSLHKRSNATQLAGIVQVRTVRLDELLATESLDKRPIALWIDTEGSAFEVIHGAEMVLPSTQMLHVEVETETIIGANQKLFQDVTKILSEARFKLVATDQPPHHLQFNALFIRTEALHSRATKIRFWMYVMKMRHAIAWRVSRWLPEKLWRKYLELKH